MKKFSLVIFSFVLAFFSAILIMPSSKSLEAEIDVITINQNNVSVLGKLNSSKSYILGGDIDASTLKFTPCVDFSGTFDGNGHKIKNLKIITAKSNVGFFASTVGATIKDLCIENLTISVTQTQDSVVVKLGSLVGDAKNTTIENCSVNGTKLFLSSVNSVYVGGLVANAEGCSIKNCIITDIVERTETDSGNDDDVTQDDPFDDTGSGDGGNDGGNDGGTTGGSGDDGSGDDGDDDGWIGPFSYKPVNNDDDDDDIWTPPVAIEDEEIIENPFMPTIADEKASVIIAVQSAISSTKNYYVGGLAGRVRNSSIFNSLINLSMKLSTLNPTGDAVGGLAGYVCGNKTNIKNNVFSGQLENGFLDEITYDYEGTNVGAFVGFVSYESDIPKAESLNYYQTDLEGDVFGNQTELEAHQPISGVDVQPQGTIDFPLSTLKIGTKTDKSNFMRQDFYADETIWFFENPWEFNSTWTIKEKLTFPFLQHFETFDVNVNEDLSFASIEKPSLQEGSVIVFDNCSTSFAYGKEIVVAGQITQVKNLNKFFEIVGLQKEGHGDELFNNLEIFAIIESAVAAYDEGNGDVTAITSDYVHTDGVNYKKYVSGENYVLEQAISATETKYICNLYEEVSLSISNNNQFKYVISNCDATDSGVYYFTLRTIEYVLKVQTENIDKGTIRRGTADSSIKQEIIEDTVSYGQRLSYVASPTDDFAFNCWSLSLDGQAIGGEDEDIEFVFDENLFLEGGIFAGFALGTDELVMFSKYTKAVCEITFKFAVNGKIVEEFMSDVAVNDKNVTAKEDGTYTYKAKMGEKYTISVVVPAGYEFTAWIESDGTATIRELSKQAVMELTASQDNETMIIVADLFIEEEEKMNDSTLLWIIIGCGGGIALCAIIIIVVVKKKKDGSYKNYY
ncbi:MAG: hypothetical protein IJA69_04125 [Clostridia bacterium]|nr:hypothetical protein [Clostridia bacterium]